MKKKRITLKGITKDEESKIRAKLRREAELNDGSYWHQRRAAKFQQNKKAERKKDGWPEDKD